MPTTLSRRVDSWFARYGESHRNPTNKAIHWICVPLITWAVLGFFHAASPYVAVAAALLALAWYASLSVPLALGMAIILALMEVSLALLGRLALPTAMIVFVLAWIGQFIGHAVEGRKPSFLEDLAFLLVGPAWLLGQVYRRLRIPY